MVMGRKLLIAFIVLLLLVVIAACGQGQEAENNHEQNNIDLPEPEEPEEQEEPEEPEEPEFPFRFPLTGIGTENEIETRPVVVMIENSPMARPQSGLDQADIVYEILSEGSITRFVAVYQSEAPDIIGPVRSIRPYFVELGAGLDGLIVHAGWSPAAKVMLTQRSLQHFDAVYGDHAYFWRSQDRRAPHNLYTSMERILNGAEAKRFRTDEWNNPEITFRDEGLELKRGEDAGKVTIPYIGAYRVAYEYVEEEGYYHRFMSGEEHRDRETEEILLAHNIIIAKTAHQVLDDVGRRAVDVTGSGEGYMVRQGKVQEVRWEQVEGMVRVFDGPEELALIPGKTWIHFIPMSSEVEFEPLEVNEMIEDNNDDE